MRVRSGVLLIVVLASACTGSGQGTPSPRPSNTEAPTANGSPTTASEPGWSAINLRFDPDAFFFTEGSVSFVEVFDEAGGLVGKTRSRDWRMFFRRQHPPGAYEAKTYRRPCDGSCRALDPPRDVCEFPVEMTPDGANRFIVVRVGQGSDCRVSDKGDVIDFDADRTVTDLTSFTQALVGAGHEVRVRPGDRWLRRFFLIRDQVVKIDHQEVHVFSTRPVRNARRSRSALTVPGSPRRTGLLRSSSGSLTSTAPAGSSSCTSVTPRSSSRS